MLERGHEMVPLLLAIASCTYRPPEHQSLTPYLVNRRHRPSCNSNDAAPSGCVSSKPPYVKNSYDNANSEPLLT